MTSIFKAVGAADFLALVPRLMGYRATRSLVLLPFDGNRTLGAIRMDLPPDPGDAAGVVGVDLDAIASTAIGLVCKVAHADAVAAVVYTDAPFAAGDGPAHATLVRALTSRADICGLRVVDALCVAADGWGSYLDPATPAAGHPLAEIPLDDDAFADLPLPEDDQGSGAELPRVDLAEKERVGRALDELDRACGALFGATAGVRDGDPRIAPGALAMACRLDDVPLLFEEALASDPATFDPYTAAALIWCIDRPMFRDVALMQWAGDLTVGDETFDAQLRWSDGEEFPADVAAPLWGDGPPPDPDRLVSALELTRRLAASAPRERRPGLLAACGWLAWALGRSSHAGRYAQDALAIEPGHGLSRIVLTFVDSMHLPEWAYDRPSPAGAVTRIIDSGARKPRT